MSKSVEELLREIEGETGSHGQTAVAPAPAGKPSRRRSLAPQSIRSSTTLLLLGAIMVIAVLGSLPVLSLALYPFSLFVTLLHETGHALATLISGGSVTGIQVSPDLSGLTTSRGGIEALIAPAGYLGATAAGCALLLAPLRYSRWVLAGFGLVPLAALLAFHPATLFTGIWGGIFALSLGVAAWKLPPRLRGFLQIFLGVEAGLNAFRDLMTLLFLSSSDAHIQTDASNMSHALFGPSIFWAVSWTVISLVLLASTVLLVLRRDVRQLRG